MYLTFCSHCIYILAFNRYFLPQGFVPWRLHCWWIDWCDFCKPCIPPMPLCLQQNWPNINRRSG